MDMEYKVKHKVCSFTVLETHGVVQQRVLLARLYVDFPPISPATYVVYSATCLNGHFYSAATYFERPLILFPNTCPIYSIEGYLDRVITSF